MNVSRLMFAFAALLPVLGIATPLLAADDAAVAALKPHRAVYAMGLAGTTGMGGPTQVRGVMYYEMTETCEAWKIDTRVLIRTVYSGGEEEVENLRKMTTWEAKDGLGFRFRVDESTQGQTDERLRGVAVIDAIGAPGVAEFTEPQSGQSDLPKGSMFPTHHMVELIRRSVAGDTHFGTVVFDGSSLDDPYEVSALIAEAPPSNLPDAVKNTLGEGKRWKARLAYFPVSKRAETPEFELSVLYRDDGIVEAVRQDYEDHSIEARLRQIEILPHVAACTAPAQPTLPDDAPPGGEDAPQ